MGDGWHANHHVFPGAANLGMLKGQYDPSYLIIRILHFAGIVKDIKNPTEETITRKLLTSNSEN